MKQPPRPEREAQRLESLRDLEILDTPPEDAFENLTRLAARLCGVPIALVSLVDAERQWFKSRHGLEPSETPRSVSFCAHALEQPDALVVPDALADERFADNPLVTGAPHIRFYAGMPLRLSDGHTVGTLCLIDRAPRDITDEQRATLRDLTSLVVDQLELRRARRHAALESMQLHGLLAALPTPVSVHRDGRVLFANRAAEEVLGLDAGALQGRAETEFIVPDTLTPRSTATHLERKLTRADGTQRTVVSVAIPVRWEGRAASVVAHRDVSAERELEQRRARASELLARQFDTLLNVFDALGDGVVVFDESFRCAWANHSMARLLDTNAEALLGETPDALVRRVAALSDDPAEVLRDTSMLRTPVEGDQTPTFTVRLARPTPRVLRRALYRLPAPKHPFVAVWTDVTREAQQLARSEEAASTDALTKLPNRRAAELALSAGGPRAVVLFDVDHFKKVNDTFGHDVGDEVLRRVAEALRTGIRAGDVVARWGGEEFIAVLPVDEAGAAQFAERVRLAVTRLETPAGPVTVSAGVGASVKAADEQLYEAKRGGRNRVARRA